MAWVYAVLGIVWIPALWRLVKGGDGGYGVLARMVVRWRYCTRLCQEEEVVKAMWAGVVVRDGRLPGVDVLVRVVVPT